MIDEIFNDNDLSDISGKIGDWPGNDSEEDDCPFAEVLLRLVLLPRPFGIPWKSDKIIKFLKKRGYRIITRFDEDAEEEYHVAVKPNASLIPEEGNLIETFVEEIQSILLKWLEKIADND